MLSVMPSQALSSSSSSSTPFSTSSMIVFVTRLCDSGCKPWPIAFEVPCVPPPNSTSVWIEILRKPSGFMRSSSLCLRNFVSILLFLVVSIIFGSKPLFKFRIVENPLPGVGPSPIGDRSTDTSKLSRAAAVFKSLFSFVTSSSLVFRLSRLRSAWTLMCWAIGGMRARCVTWAECFSPVSFFLCYIGGAIGTNSPL